MANYEPGTITPVLGDWLRIDLIHNAGGLFGLLQGTAAVFAVVPLVVVGLIASMELRWGWRSWVTTLALGLLLPIALLVAMGEYGAFRGFTQGRRNLELFSNSLIFASITQQID